MSKTQYIGISKNCHTNCHARSQQIFKQAPHSQKHQIFEYKQFFKKLTRWKIVSVSQLIQKFTEMIEGQIQMLIGKIRKNKEQAINKLQETLFGCIIQNGVNLQRQLIDNLKTLGNYQYEILTCNQLYTISESINKNCKQSKLQQKAEDFFKEFKNKLQMQFLQNMSNISNKQSQITKNSRIKNSQAKQFDNSNNPYTESEVETFKLDESSEISIQFQNNKKLKQSQVSKCGQSLINVLDKFVNDSTDGPVKQIFFNDQSPFCKNKSFEKKKQQKKQANQQKSLRDFDIDENKMIPNRKKQSDKDSDLSMNMSCVDFDTITQQKQDVTGSYVKKNQGKYYIRVAHLLKSQYKQQKQKATFNIKLKVVQQLMFRFYKDPKTHKVHSKMKFIGGDETGLIVCYSNFIPQIRKGEYLSLYDCTLTNFYDISYEITCNKLKKCDDIENFKVNMDLSISRFESIKPLIYSVQKYDTMWPSIRGIAYLLKEKKKKVQIIAKVLQIIQQNQNIYRCYLGDGTGKVSAIISKQICPKLLEGSVYFFKRLQAFSEIYMKQRLIYLTSSQNNDGNKKPSPPALMDDYHFKYDNMDMPNISQIKIEDE